MRLFKLGGDLIRENLDAWVRGEVHATPQDSTKATYTTKLEKKDGRAQWDLSAEELFRMHQAFTPWPGLYTQWKDKRLKLIDVYPMKSTEGLPLGRVISVDGDDAQMGIVTGEGLLCIKAVQLEGGKAMSTEEFLRGHRELMSATLPS